MRNRLFLIALSAAVAGVSACSRQEGPSTVQALDPWCRPAPAGAFTAACYVTLTANTEDRFAAASTSMAERVEIHTMSMDGGIMRMRPLPEGVKLPRNEGVALKPGSEHLMLIGPKTALVEGQSVTLTLSFEKAPPVVIKAPVRRAPVAGGH